MREKGYRRYAMDSLQILKSLSKIHSHTVGVFPADQIPRVWMRPAAFIVNTDDHTKSGTHWVAIYIDKCSNALYFDSFGLPPFVPDHINRLRKNCKKIRWNNVRLQSDFSDVCGQYCIMFLRYMSEGLGYHKFIENFSENLDKNDEIVRRYVGCKKRSNKSFIGSGGCIIRCVQSCCPAKMSLL